MILELRTDPVDIQFLHIFQEYYRMRIAHGYACDLIFHPVHHNWFIDHLFILISRIRRLLSCIRCRLHGFLPHKLFIIAEYFFS